MCERNKLYKVCLSVFFCITLCTFLILEWGTDTKGMTWLLRLDSCRQLVMNRVGYEDGYGFMVRDSENRLHSLCDQASRETLESEIESLETLKNYCKEDGIPFLYMQAPFKADTYENDLPYGIEDYAGENSDYVLNRLNQYGIDTLDLRMYLTDENVFYKTDHHWQVKSAFEASVIVAKTLASYDGLSGIFQEDFGDISNYENIIYKDFLGSYGRRAGRDYSGLEDFTYLFPLFDTGFHFQHIKNGEVAIDKNGTFEKALISNPLESDYYCSYMNNSYEEMRIENLCSKYDKKVLVISDSFGRTMCCYLSLYFRTLANLDTQDERFCGSIKAYIDEYEPDVVIVMFNSGMYEHMEVYGRLEK